MKRFLIPFCAAILGVGLLLALHRRVDFATGWNVQQDRATLLHIAHQMARKTGLDTTHWPVEVSASIDRDLHRYRLAHPSDPAVAATPDLTAKVIFTSPEKKGSFTATLFPDSPSDTHIAGWEREEQGFAEKASTKADMAKASAIAEEALRSIVGNRAAEYHLVNNAAESKEGLRFTWERNATSPNAIEDSVEVAVRGGAATSAEWKRPVPKSSDSGAKLSPVGTLTFFDVVLWLIAGVICIVIYVIAFVRRSIAHRGPISFGLLAFLLSLVKAIFSEDLQNAVRISSSGEASRVASVIVILLNSLVAGAAVIIVAGAGQVVASQAGNVWFSLRTVLSRFAISRPVGESVLAGLLLSPLLAAFPFVLAAVPVLGAFRWEGSPLNLLFSRSPLLASGSSLSPQLLGVFGVIFPLLDQRISSTKLRRVLQVSLGCLLMSGPNSEFRDGFPQWILAGVGLFLGLAYLNSHFGLLAIVVAALGKAWIVTAVVFFSQPHSHQMGWKIIAILSSGVIVSLLIFLKGRNVEATSSGTRLILEVASERDRLRAEFSIAHRAQQEMLPASPPALDGFELAASCSPSKEVGGDLYDFLQLPDGRWALGVADVSGKGVPAALYMTLTKGLLASITQHSSDLAAIVSEVNLHLYTAGRRKIFVTMALGALDPQSRVLEYARAGHNPVIWRRRHLDSTSLVQSGGMGLGITAGKVFERTLAIERMKLEDGDTVVFYSDGLTEAMNIETEQFGEDRLMAAVERTDDMTATAARTSILDEISAFLDGVHPQDDMTLVVLRVGRAAHSAN